MSQRQKILCITGTRADFGLMTGVYKAIEEAPDFELELLVTGMHLMEKFGRTVTAVEAAGHKHHVLEAVFQDDDKASMAAFLGEVVAKGTKMVQEIQPDVIMLLGDRAEMLAGAIVGAYSYLPTVHIGGGDETSTIDNSVRHAITKLAHLHFAPTEQSRQRLLQMGEAAFRCFNSGAPALDTILHRPFPDRATAFSQIGLDPTLTTQLILLHPESLHTSTAAEQMACVLDASLSPDRQSVLIYSNADAGGQEMIKEIESRRGQPQVHIFQSLPYADYLNLLKHADLMIGNSSSGILEAPSFKLPVVNVGDRQRGREQAANILNTPYERAEIQAAIQKALTDAAFKADCQAARNPYGEGRTGEIILERLRKIEWNGDWLQKNNVYTER